MTFATNLVTLGRRVVGVLANNLVALDGNAKLPAVDGSQLTGLIKGQTAVALSGTVVDFTGIPSVAKRITIALASLSTTGASHVLLQLGKSAGIENTGYAAYTSISTTGSGGSSMSSTAGFFAGWTGGAAVVSSSVITLINVGGNRWVASLAGGLDNSAGIYYGFVAGGDKTLGGVLDRLRLTPANGTDTFDSGTATVLWE
ncbi:hypothetical protein [Pleomorphomonas oryzae]|uniref:hypothetical protein n=1 Tax=Pleomorphomonas oryzae TaxID=261934 RepID=UPI000479DD92|nr:hypothetical protein [Pleomorphomonas oryzae]